MDSIIFTNEAAADGAISGKLTSFLAQNTKVDKTVVTNLVTKIYSTDDDKVLIWLNDSRVRALDWNPNTIVDTDLNDPKWIKNEV
jgi:hypothetical protein